MAPLRNNRASHRSTRTQIDPDIMEGLPVRQWKESISPVNLTQRGESSSHHYPTSNHHHSSNSATTTTHNATTTSTSNTSSITTAAAGAHDSIWKELPMPRGSELYSPMSQALLRAARMGHFNRPAPPSALSSLEDEKELGLEDEAGERETEMGFMAKRWQLVPKELEEVEPEYLAKRRVGLASTYGAGGTVGGGVGTAAAGRGTGAGAGAASGPVVRVPVVTVADFQEPPVQTAVPSPVVIKEEEIEEKAKKGEVDVTGLPLLKEAPPLDISVENVAGQGPRAEIIP